MTDELPKLPAEISPDGREIWDWAHALSAHRQRFFKIRQLKADIASVGKRCGDCNFWMKSRLCPKEHNVNGRNRGPSGDAYPCSKFSETASASERRQKLSAELAALEPKP